MARKLTTSDFIKKARLTHGDKYDYSQTTYLGAKHKLKVICPIHGVFSQLPHAHIGGQGCPSCYHTLLGIASYDCVGDDCRVIRDKWKSMINRCYNKKAVSRRITYQNCHVCSEWLTFGNFKKWVEDPKNGYQDGYHLDKDILVKGNREYSPNTCCFVPNEINVLLTRRQNRRGKYPIGVSLVRGFYVANVSINSRQIRIGSFRTPQEAFYAYKFAKEKHIKELAERYFQDGKITEKVYNALIKYEVDIDD